MKIFFGYTQIAAVTYYRFISYAKYMRRIKGVEVAYSNYTTDDRKLISWQFELGKNDVVMKQLEMLFENADVSVIGALSSPMAVSLVLAARAKYKKPIFMEIDDYILNLPGYNIASNSYTPGSNIEWVVQKQMESSDGLIVSTNYLKKLYSGFNKNIYVIPNGVDLEVWKKIKIKKRNDSKVRIGFSGSPNHTGDIRMLKNVIELILSMYDNVEFYFKACCPEFLQNKKNVILDDNWKLIDEYPQDLADAGFDIAIAPLRDNNFNRCKSNLRYLEMSMLKIPTVASNINDYKDTIQHGVTGYLCNNDDEWINTLSLLIENVKLRHKIGNSAYNYICGNYNIKDIAKNYVNTLKSVKNIKVEVKV